MSLDPCAEKLVVAVNNRKLDDMMQHVHNLKGSSRYVGAARLHDVCHLIQVSHINRQPNVIRVYYAKLVEQILDFKRLSRKILAHFNGDRDYKEFNIGYFPLARGFRIEYSPIMDSYFCASEN
jgi:hypothetical protein